MDGKKIKQDKLDVSEWYIRVKLRKRLNFIRYVLIVTNLNVIVINYFFNSYLLIICILLSFVVP